MRALSSVPRIPSITSQYRTMSSVTIPKTIKAIQVDHTGGPEVNVLREIPTPQPKEDEVLIKVQWSGVNFIDNYFRSGLYPVKFPYTVGQDSVGKVVIASSLRPDISVGQRVFTTAPSAFAEYQVAPANRIALLPDDVDAKDGVSLGTQGLTALYLLKESYKVQKGDWILNRAAAGGVGLILSQLAKSWGAHVIGTVSTPEKAEIAKSNGAEHVLLSIDSSEDNIKKILELTGGQGVHAAYDGVGKDTFEEDLQVVRRKGTIVSYGNSSGAVPPFPLTKLSAKSLKVTRPTLNSTVSTPEEYKEYTEEIVDIVSRGQIKFAVHKVYGFTAEEVAQAQKDIQGRGTIGKLLIHVSD